MKGTAMARALLVVCLVALVATAHAAGSPEAARDRARTFFVLRVVDALDLPDDKALVVRGIFHRADERRVELTARRQALQDQLRTALAHKPVDTDALGRLVSETSAVDHELAAVADDAFKEAQAQLTVEQQARLLLLRRELQGQVREAVRRRLGKTAPTHLADKHVPATTRP